MQDEYGGKTKKEFFGFGPQRSKEQKNIKGKIKYDDCKNQLKTRKFEK